MLDLTGKRVTVMGLGRFGGGIGVVRFLTSPPNDCQVLVTDLDPADKLTDSLAAIDDLVRTGRVTLRLGEHNVSDFTTTDLVVANPAVPKPWDNRFLRAAHAAGIPVTTEIRLLVERLPARSNTIGITGSAGKSTTSSMIAHILTRHAGDQHPPRRVHLGGNIGGSLLNQLHDIAPDDLVVLELSSAMLYWLSAGTGYPDAPGWSPATAVLTNISPNHIDWHGTLDHYAASKLNIVRFQAPARDHLVTPMSPDDPLLALDAGPERGFEREGPGSIVHPRSISSALFLPSDYADRYLDPALTLSVPGSHNRRNAALASATCAVALRSSSIEPLARSLSHHLADFHGLAHRLSLVGTFNNIRFYNDSKCTTPDSCLLALSAFTPEQGGPSEGLSRVHLIAGGYDKGSDLSPIGRAAADLAGLYTLGKTGPAIAAAAPPDKVTECGTLDAAVRQAIARARPGDIVLLSPACASWDQFINFEQRGDLFAQLVRTLAAPACVTTSSPAKAHA